MDTNNAAKSYDDKSHLVGRISMISVFLILLSVPLAFSIRYGVFPDIKSLDVAQVISIFVMFYATAIVEMIAYTPLLGTSGMYLSFVTGNIANLKLPCAIAAMNNADVKPASEEGEIISTIAIASSSIVTTLILAAFVLLFRPVLPLLTAEGSLLSPAFKQVLPCLFGALAASYFYKHWKLGIAPIIALVIVLLISGGIPAGTLIPIGVVVALVAAHILYKKNLV